ncbi:hypothetical protein BpHYR1_048165 [Brachionus plicatilis]|uniref:Uncharacterized protein n=1 Tax=Brachionus plicatilis TaxID=10195 RepID=A0A3M7QHG4_BRAPC|nr:hypothetical protein BpHYR1_048165 [Brachionus plicatilis]
MDLTVALIDFEYKYSLALFLSKNEASCLSLNGSIFGDVCLRVADPLSAYVPSGRLILLGAFDIYGLSAATHSVFGLEYQNFYVLAPFFELISSVRARYARAYDYHIIQLWINVVDFVDAHFESTQTAISTPLIVN